MILTDKLITTKGGGGGCSATTEMLLIDWTTASHLHQLIGCWGHAVHGDKINGYKLIWKDHMTVTWSNVLGCLMWSQLGPFKPHFKIRRSRLYVDINIKSISLSLSLSLSPPLPPPTLMYWYQTHGWTCFLCCQRAGLDSHVSSGPRGTRSPVGHREAQRHSASAHA